MQVFLSYARPDQGPVEELYGKLAGAGFRPWMDTRDIHAGENWRLAIEQAIQKSSFFLACLSSRSVDRRGVLQRELRAALDVRQEKLDTDIYLIPVRLDECEVPDKLREFQWVDLFKPEGWPRLERALRTGLERLGVTPGPAVRSFAGPATVPAPGSGPSPDAGALLPVTLRAPDGAEFEAQAPAEALSGQLLREFLDHWGPLSATGKGLQRYSLALAGRPLAAWTSLREAGVGPGARLDVAADPLGLESPVGLSIADAEGHRFTTAVLLSTPVRQLAEAFLGERGGAAPPVVELVSAPGGPDASRQLALDATLFDEGVGDGALLRIYRSPERLGAENAG